MKTLGLIGGTTWISTIDYYSLINKKVNEQLGGIASARLLLYSVNFEDFRPPVNPDEWGGLTKRFIAVAKTLERAGADAIMFCANTPHLIAEKLQDNIDVPLIHIAQAAADEIKSKQLKKVVLLGTRITMEQKFFKEKLAKNGISALVPETDDRQFIHDAVFNEMSKDIFLPETKQRFLEIIDVLISQGAEGVILGCTEFPHLIKSADVSVPLFDTTVIHAEAGVSFILSEP